MEIKLNGINIVALLDTGSQLNALSEELYRQHKEQLGSFEILRMQNTVVKGAIRNKSRNITHQIWLKQKSAEE